jgi:NAD+ kinase
MRMTAAGFQFHRFAILMHPSIARACEQAEVLQKFLFDHGASEAVCSDIHDQTVRERIARGDFDLLIPMGGDGTALRAARLGAPAGIPILGINLGRSGFLMEMGQRTWKDYIPRLFSGEYRLENRMLLAAEHWRGTEKLGAWDVVNDVVVCRGQYVRPINLAASVDGFPLANYLADGLIVATPTGSTAYSLAVGGPILPPDLRNILIVPVAPHLSLDRAIVLPETAEIEVRVRSRHEAVLSVDGQAGILMENDDYILVKVNPLSVDFVRFLDKGSFYRNLTCSMERNSCIG